METGHFPATSEFEAHMGLVLEPCDFLPAQESFAAFCSPGTRVHKGPLSLVLNSGGRQALFHGRPDHNCVLSMTLVSRQPQGSSLPADSDPAKNLKHIFGHGLIAGSCGSGPNGGLVFWRKSDVEHRLLSFGESVRKDKVDFLFFRPGHSHP